MNRITLSLFQIVVTLAFLASSISLTSSIFGHSRPYAVEHSIKAKPDDVKEAGLGQNMSIHGRVVKGVISGATITAYPIVVENGNYIFDPSTPLASSNTDSNGYFQLKLSKGRQDHYYYLEMTVSGETQMICDFHEGCWSQNTNSLIPFGQKFSPSSEFKLSNVVKSKRGEISNAPISPLTHLSTIYMDSLDGRYSPENINYAYEYIESMFGLEAGSLVTAPADLTSLDSIKRLKEKPLKLGVISASFAPLISGENWDDIVQLDLNEIFNNAYQLTLFLKQLSNSSQHIKTLSSIESVLESLLVNSDVVTEPLTITSHPQSQALSEGEPLLLLVEAQGNGELNYQWQKGGSLLIGEVSSVLSIDAVSINDTGTYSVTVVDDIATVQSEFAEVLVTEAPTPVSITEHPADATSVEGATASFSVAATGDGFLVYQWRKDGKEIENANDSGFSISATQLADEGIYDVLISNTAGTATSLPATLNVIPNIEPAIIIAQPSSVKVAEGDSATLSVETRGGGTLIHKWYKDGKQLANQFDNTLIISAAQHDDQGNYYLQVSNEVSQINSETASIVVESASTMLPTPKTVFLSWTVPASREDGSVLPISDISAYSIMFRPSNSEAHQVLKTANGTDTLISLELMPADYEFRIATIDHSGIVGAYSAPLIVAVD